MDVREVGSAEGAARYITKYLRKGFLQHEALEEAGFKRRYSRSQNWPSGGLMRLRGSEEDLWEGIELVPGRVREWKPGFKRIRSAVDRKTDCPAMDVVGDDLGLLLKAKREKSRTDKTVERIANWVR